MFGLSLSTFFLVCFALSYCVWIALFSFVCLLCCVRFGFAWLLWFLCFSLFALVPFVVVLLVVCFVGPCFVLCCFGLAFCLVMFCIAFRFVCVLLFRFVLPCVFFVFGLVCVAVFGLNPRLFCLVLRHLFAYLFWLVLFGQLCFV